MADATLSADEIASRLAAEFDIDSGGDTENIVHARLAELSGLGLVERIPV